MQNLVWKLLLIVAILGLCAYAIIPPKDTIRLGKDLRGGVSLIYSVQIPDDESDPQAVLRQVIEVLKERVNPKGVFDISMQPVGLDRIEIVMPLPNKEVQALRRSYQDILEDLLERAQIPESDLDEAIRLDQAIALFGGDPATDRGRLISDLQATHDGLQAAQVELQEANAAGAAADAIARLEQNVADTEIGYEELRDEVLRLSLDRSRLVRTLKLPTTREAERDEITNEKKRDDQGNEIIGPSQRELALDGLRAEFAHLADDLEQVVAAHDAYEAKRTGFDDPEDLKRLLRGAGVLEFHIAVVREQAEGVNVDDLLQQLLEVGPDNTDSAAAQFFPINDLKQWYDSPEQLAALEANPTAYLAGTYGLVAGEFEDQVYLLLYTTDAKAMTGRDWGVDSTFQTVDRLGRPAVGFRLDAAGGGKMSRLTAPHVGQPMAIVLDGQVYSAPNLNSQIGNSGIIQGSFSADELSYLTRVLAAGALGARLSPEPIAINQLGPTIGADNLRRGLDAFVIAIIAVALFMLAYYFMAGAVADFALLANGLIIFGVMALIQGTFTLPGLAGIVLTIGMAVDANVLIYERIREELFGGENDLRAAVREGYRKALSTIIDANVTNLIICLVLFKTATAEVKGFALTLTIGICATLFTALFVTRVIFYIYTDVLKREHLHMLPTVVPGIHRALEPAINWVGMRRIFWTVSAIALIASIALVGSRGVNMFDTEFRGGVSATMRTALVERGGDPDGPRTMLKQADVETRVREIATVAEMIPVQGVEPSVVDAVRPEFDKAVVLTVGDTVADDTGAVTGDSFQVKISNPKGLDDETAISDVVIALLVEEFGEQLDVAPALQFQGIGTDEWAAHTVPIEDIKLGANLGRPDITDRVARYRGGVAVMIEQIEPPVTVAAAAQRVDRMRQQPDFADCAGRSVKVFGLDAADPADPSTGFSSIVVVVFDPELSFLRLDDLEVWDQRLAQREWALVSQAMMTQSSLEQVSSFSSAIAQTLSAQAIVAVALSLIGILIYIWIRFGSLRYSLAAIAALVHDVTIALGLLALTAVIGGTALGAFLGIDEFRIDLGVVAALLTIIGYSLNDTIVILDRIRENRGKLPIPTASIVNRSINQTVSRTLLTSVTTLLAVGIMYAEGGTGIRPFAFCLLIGLVVGTYSSIAVAAPLVFKGDTASGAEDKDDPSSGQAADSMAA